MSKTKREEVVYKQIVIKEINCIINNELEIEH